MSIIALWESQWESVRKIHLLSLHEEILNRDILNVIKRRLILYYSHCVLREALESGKWMYDLEYPEGYRLVFNPQHHLYHYHVLNLPEKEDLVWIGIPKTDFMQVEVNQLFYNTRKHQLKTLAYVTKETARSEPVLVLFFSLFLVFLCSFWELDEFKDSGNSVIELLRYMSYIFFRCWDLFVQFLTMGTIQFKPLSDF